MKTYIDGLKAAREIVEASCKRIWESTDHRASTAQLIIRNHALAEVEQCLEQLRSAITEAEEDNDE